MDIPFELVPETQAEQLRWRLAVQKRAERLALRDRMRARKKVRMSLDGRERCVPWLLPGWCSWREGGGARNVAMPPPPVTVGPPCRPCSAESSDSDSERETMRQALTTAPSSPAEEGAPANLASATP